MTASELAHSLGLARLSGSSWRARCPSHEDQHPSLDITDKNGRTLFICRGGCTQAEVLTALRERGLWSAERQSSRPVEDPYPASAFHGPRRAPCCKSRKDPSEPRCEHWKEFDYAMTCAALHRDLFEASREIVNLHECAGYRLDVATLVRELTLSISVGSIASNGLDDETVAATIAKVAESVADDEMSIDSFATRDGWKSAA